jgi:hypothetical protein
MLQIVSIADTIFGLNYGWVREDYFLHRGWNAT